MIKPYRLIFYLILVFFLTAAAMGCQKETVAGVSGAGEHYRGGAEKNENVGKDSYAGKYVGYSWRGEARGVAFKNADQYVETILELDDDGIIVDAKINFFIKVDGFWTMRQSGHALVIADYSVDPEPAVPGENYRPGKSMFTICTVDRMSFYAVGVDQSGVVAVAVVDPITRYQFEMKFPAGFDFSRIMGEMTIGSGHTVPTVRTSGSGFLRPDTWERYSDKTIFNVYKPWSWVLNLYGPLKGIDNDNTVKTFLEALGVTFDNGRPQPMKVAYGYFGIGGWNGNARALEAYLIGRDAKTFTSLVDWSEPRYANAINDKNQFGVDVRTGATRTVQNSFDGVSGATVRISREATSYQRALVAAGILKESDVIIGRF